MHISVYNKQWFLVETRAISLNYSRLSICQMFLIPEALRSEFPSYLSQGKRKMNSVIFTRAFFAFKNSGWAMSLEEVFCQ